MADEQTQTPTKTDTPSLGDLIAWDTEAKGAPPVETVPLADIKTYFDSHKAELEADFAARMQRTIAERDQRVQATQRMSAEQQQDIDFYNDLRGRLRADDVDARAKATADYEANEDRYLRGAALVRQHSAETNRREALAGLFDDMHSELEAAGLKGILPSRATPEFTTFATSLADFDTKGGLAGYLIERGRALGIEAGRAAMREELEREGRIETGMKSTGPEGGQGGGGGAAGRYGNPAWVAAQKAETPDWAFKPSGETDEYGRALSNHDLVKRALKAQSK